MGKGKGKSRQDKFYYLAKDQGFRARSAFKLIQLNRKFNFLNNAQCLIDLCAAPGGWYYIYIYIYIYRLQVAEKYMPLNSIKLGFDLEGIKPLKGCTTYIADITTDKCKSIIKRELKLFQADVVLHDGAPNVGTNWNLDAFSQNELVLHALKIAALFLKKGGTFVTKVFRSRDYENLIWAFRQLFYRVDATKPIASRQQSAEIFVVCSQYKAPRDLNKDLFDVRYVLKENEYEEDTVSSLKQLFKTKRTLGYSEDIGPGMHLKTPICQFVNDINPFQILSKSSQFTTADEESKKLLELVPFGHQGLDIYIKDLKVLGKSEISALLKWRHKIKVLQHAERKATKGEDIDFKGNNEEEKNELEEYIYTQDKKTKKRENKSIKKLEHTRKKIEKSEFAGEAAGESELNFGDLLDKSVDIQNVGYIDISDIDEDAEEYKLFNEEEEDSSEGDTDDDLKHVNKMDQEIHDMLQREKEQKMSVDRKTMKKISRKQMRAKGLEEKEINEEIEFDGYNSDDDDEDLDKSKEEQNKEVESKIKGEESMKPPVFGPERPPIFQNPLKLGIQNILNQTHSSTERPEKGKGKRLAPENDLVMGEDDQDESFNPQIPKSEREKRKLKLKKEREKKEFKSTNKFGFEEVARQEDNMSGNILIYIYIYIDYSSDDIAETVAIAKEMLRKKRRIEIEDMSYNRYSFHDTDTLPDWFKEEEKVHMIPMLPVTKEQIEAEKLRIKEFNARPPKKVAQAKARKKIKLAKKMMNLRHKANSIVNQVYIFTKYIYIYVGGPNRRF